MSFLFVCFFSEFSFKFLFVKNNCFFEKIEFLNVKFCTRNIIVLLIILLFLNNITFLHFCCFFPWAGINWYI
eukprot:UN04264